MELIRRYFRVPDGSFFLFGPRGTGKSTFLKQKFLECLFVDLLDPETMRSLRAFPERLIELVRGSPHCRMVVIDEVQRAVELLPVIHKLMEEGADHRYVLTGSSARKLKRSGVDLLAGRAILKTMHPFIAAELGPQFDLDKALTLGLLPLVLGSRDPADTLRSYVALYVREEVQMEGLIRNIGGFSRFLEAISFSHASVLNMSNVARECQIERKVVEGYVQVLEDILLSFRVPVFVKRAKRQLSAHSKFYYLDAGVYRSLRPKGTLDQPQEIGGLALEGLVAQHLRAWIAYTDKDYSLHFWRTRSGVEVDFVVYGEDGILALEVKNSARVDSRDCSGLRAFQEDYPESQAVLLYRGKHVLVKDKVLCVPCERFLLTLTPDLSLSGLVQSLR